MHRVLSNSVFHDRCNNNTACDKKLCDVYKYVGVDLHIVPEDELKKAKRIKKAVERKMKRLEKFFFADSDKISGDKISGDKISGETWWNNITIKPEKILPTSFEFVQSLASIKEDLNL